MKKSIEFYRGHDDCLTINKFPPDMNRLRGYSLDRLFIKKEAIDKLTPEQFYSFLYEIAYPITFIKKGIIVII